MTKKIIVITVIAITLFSCNHGKKSESEGLKESLENSSVSISNQTTIKDSLIENIQWKLITLEGHEVHKLDETDQEIHFLLNSNGRRVSGYSGCNTFVGTYVLESGNRIKFSKLASTRKACPVAAINEAELLSTLEMADNFSITDDILIFNVANRAILAEFKRQ